MILTQYPDAMNGSPTRCITEATNTTARTCICPHCGGFHDICSVFITVPPKRPPGEWLRQLSLERSKLAVSEVQGMLRRIGDDPGHSIAVQDRHRPYVRPRAKKRVCSGSAHYRVMIK
jgi:hypothetical protein